MTKTLITYDADYRQVVEVADDQLEALLQEKPNAYVLEETVRFYAPLAEQLLFSAQAGSDVVFSSGPVRFLLKKVDDAWSLLMLEGTLYRNNKRLSTSETSLTLGDELAFDGVVIKAYPDQLDIRGAHQVSSNLLPIEKSQYAFYEDYPDYHRSPRIIYRPVEDRYQITAPSSEPNKPKNELLKMLIPPVVMFGVTILISIVRPRGIYILMSIVSSIMTAIFSVQNYFKTKRDYKKSLEDRIDSYHAYLSDKSIELTKLAKAQKEGQLYHYPDVTYLSDLAQGFSHRIYEKTPQHFDFLYYRLGLGSVPVSYQLSYSQTERSGIKDPLEEEGYRLYRSHKTIEDMPIVANLTHGPVGYVGPRNLVLEQLMLMVNQLAFFHSYHDLQVITVMPEEEKADWEWMRWLPHASLREMNVRGFIYNQRTRDQVLNSLNQILKLRKAQVDEAGAKETLFSPHYVVLITDEKLVLDHVIMEFFNEDPTIYGVSLIFVADVMSSLSENIKTVINIKDRQTGQLVLEEGHLREVDFSLDHFPEGFDKEVLTRRLAPLNHLQNLKSSIPDTVTFMELYEADSFEDLKVLERWAQNAPYRSLSVPLGLRGQGDIVSLDLHEKAHGPHGLVAGTTGSGKSEIIQSYILSLAVNFHPHDVAFLLIDYKGGGMANLFKDLPHLLGTITNLDGNQSMRALVSINAELKRRQRLFAQYDVNHINQYQKKYKLGEAKEPMPHLFLISDEFAELKQNQPDFMTELVSTARIGRSLGIHLILATQKPTGVVNDQIWSNSRFKLALKVADKQDSMEILKTADAADITQAGRAYLQVGNNEVYELFQSAWSGADYQKSKDEQGIEDHTIYAINALGQYEVLNQDLSGLDEVEAIQQVPTELEAIVENIKNLTSSLGIQSLPQPWLPPLEERIFVQDFRPDPFQVLWEQEPSDELTALYGYADIPSQQEQKPVTHTFETDGHIALFSSPTMGKSTFIQTLVMDLARQKTPEDLHFYLLDFGTNGLLPLKGLPHVADYIEIEDEEKITRLIRRITDEIRHRKKLFSQYSVANIQTYRKISGQTLPNIVFMLDNYDAVRGHKLEAVIDQLLQSVAREGASLGLYLVMTAARFGTIKPSLMANLKRRIVLKLNDDNEPKTILGRTNLIIDSISGRGLVTLDEPEAFQIFLPSKGKDDIRIVENLRTEAQTMDEAWTGSRPESIPTMPDHISMTKFLKLPSVTEAIANDILPIGLDFDQVRAKGVPLKDFNHLMILSDKEKAKQLVMRHLMGVVKGQFSDKTIYLFDLFNEYDEYRETNVVYHDSESDYKQVFDEIKQLIEDKKVHQEKVQQFIFISDLPSFLTTANLNDKELIYLFEEGTKVGIHVIYGVMKSYTIATSSVQRYLKNNVDTAIIAMKMADQSIFTRSSNEREGVLLDNEIYLHMANLQTRLKITSPKVTQ